MAVRFILMMALMMVASADPAPDPGINIENVVNAVAECGGGCCGNHCDKKGCLFGNEVYPDKCCLKKTCMELCCNDGQWEVDKKNFINDKTCGRCIVDGDPHIHSFDQITNPVTDKYRLNYAGTFAIAQLGRTHTPFFGVKAHVDKCKGTGPLQKCVRSITYHEPGIEIKLEIADPTNEKCPYLGIPGQEGCKLKATVNNIPHWPVSTSVTTISGALYGEILLFKKTLDPILPGYENVECINIVGTQGFSLALCTAYTHIATYTDGNYPFLYIWSTSNLINVPSKLYGMCNTYTGTGVNIFGFRHAGHNMLTSNCLTAGIPAGTWDVCSSFASDWVL